MNTDGLQLGARFAWSAPVCTDNKNRHLLETRIISGVSDRKLATALTKYKSMLAYLRVLSAVIQLDIFSPEVVSAYWLGGPCLKLFKPEHFRMLLDEYQKVGIPQNTISEMANLKPEKFIPLHLFKVLLEAKMVEVVDKFNLVSVNNCLVTCGRIENISENYLIVSLMSLTGKSGHLTRIMETKSVNYRPDFLSGLKLHDLVAVHGDWAVTKLALKDQWQLYYWTDQVLKYQF